MFFKPEQMVFGLKKGKFTFDDIILTSLTQIGKKLNALTHGHKSRAANGAQLDIPLTQNVCVYKTMKYTLESLLAQTDNDIR